VPIRYAIQDQTLVISAAGHYDITDIARVVDAAITSPQFKPGLSLLLDWQASLEMPRTSELPSRWTSLASVRSLIAPQVAFVANNPADLERGRMFANFVRPHGFVVEVFTDMDEAQGWLNSHRSAGS
jgi:hypothetical protein